MPSPEEIASAVWSHPILRRETDDPKDQQAAEDAVSYAARWAYNGLNNDKELRAQILVLQQDVNTLTELVRSLAAPPVPPAGG